jgi:hypothetical protein
MPRYLSAGSLSDPGFARADQYGFPEPKTPLSLFVAIFYGYVLLVAGMFGWALWRRRKVHPALLVGGISLIGAELLTAFAYFNPTWSAMTTSIVHAWGYAGGMP